MMFHQSLGKHLNLKHNGGLDDDSPPLSALARGKSFIGIKQPDPVAFWDDKGADEQRNVSTHFKNQCV